MLLLFILVSFSFLLDEPDIVSTCFNCTDSNSSTSKIELVKLGVDGYVYKPSKVLSNSIVSFVIHGRHSS